MATNSSRRFSTTSYPLALAIAISVLASGRITTAQNLFVADDGSGNIYELMPDGSRSTFASGLDNPSALAFNSSGYLFVSASVVTNNSPSCVIYDYTPNGTRSTFASGLSNPQGLAFTSSGDLFVADSYNIYE